MRLELPASSEAGSGGRSYSFTEMVVLVMMCGDPNLASCNSRLPRINWFDLL